MAFLSLDAARASDPIITSIAQGYKNAEGVASFVAPAVPVPSKAGRTLVFGKESFANMSLFRAPGAQIPRITNGFSSRSFALRQEAISWEVTEEMASEAKTNAAQIDLRRYAALDAAKRLMQSWEVQVANAVLNPAIYEASCVQLVAPADQFDKATADVEIQIDVAKEAVRSQIGVYPNKLLLSPQAYNGLKRNKRIREYLQRGVLVNEQTLAQIFGLDEVRVARRLVLDEAGNLVNIYNNCALLFYQPMSATDGMIPAIDANYGTPSFAATYMLDNSIISTPERFDLERRVFRGDLLVERSVEIVAMGQNNLVGGGYLFQNVATA